MKKHGFILLKKKIEFLFYLFFISLPLLFLSGPIFAGTPNWSKSTVNGNFLTLTPELSWTDAEAWAQEWGGHLVTLRSWQEEKWIKETFGTNQYFWIGFSVIGREHSEENFYWSSGEAVTYTNWASHEPSNTGGVENVTVMNDAPHLPSQFGDYWNDSRNDASHKGVAEIVTDDELGLVLESFGEVSITRSTPQTKQGGDTIRKGDLLKTVDRINTYTNGLMKAAFPAEQGYRQIEIYSETEVRVAEIATPFQTTLEFFRGKIKSIIEDLPEDYGYEVITPQAVIGHRGTEFIIEGDESSIELTVIEGSVEVTNLDSTQSVTINENQAVQATTEGIGEPYEADIEPDYFDEGSGAEHDPWLIGTAEHLNNVRHFLGEEHQDKHFKQTANINLGESPWNDGEGWVPIGYADSAFYGHYDGNGKEISNLNIHRDTIAYQGLFGWNNGTISNLGVTDASVTDNGSRAGILAGVNDSGLIVKCYTTGTIQSNHEDGRIGGLAGWNSSTIKDSHSTAFVATKGVLTGGLTGVNSGGSVIDCYAGGEVHSASIQVGGLAGSNQAGGQIIRCYATGKTTGENYVGGLVGSNRGENSTIDECYSTGNVVGNDCVGGLVGIQFNSCQISKSHSMGAVQASGNWAGGLIGLCFDYARLTDSYSASNVYAVGYSVGGLCGSLEENSLIQNSYAMGAVYAEENWAGGLVGMCYDHAMISESYSASDVYAEGYSAGGLCGSIERNCTIKNAYANGNVSGLEWTGGLAGWADSSQIINSYSTCHVLSEYGINTGGLTGGGSETEIVHSFWNTETSGQIANEGGEGKNTSELLSQTTFTEWNFDSIWSIDEESSYPYLQWQEEPWEHNYPEDIPATIRVPSMFSTIQEGIDKAGHGNTVLVADGIYTGRGNLYLSFKGKGIVLKSENGPEQCIIDYQDGLEEGAVFVFKHGETRESILEGFTLLNGPVAMYIENASPTIKKNVVKNNATGIMCGPGSSPLLLKNSIIQNSGTPITCDNSSAEIKRNLIRENGGGRFSNVTTTTFGSHQEPDKTYITGSTEHGGIAATNSSSPTIQNNLILHNRGMDSGAIYADSTSTVTIVNNHILGNASINGGSVFVENPSSKIVNNLIAYTGSSESSEGLSRWYKDPLFMHFVYDGAKLEYVNYYFGFVNYGEPCEVSLSGCAGLGGHVWAETGERFWVTVRSEVDQFGHGGGLKVNVNSDAGNFSITQTIAQYSGGCNMVSSTDIKSYGISEGGAGAGISLADGIEMPLIAHNNVFGNSGSNYAYISSGDEEGGAFDLTGSNGNISQEPGLDSVTFELCAESPCIDAGTTDIDGLDFGVTDYSGHARITDGNGDGNPIVDIGAFEFQDTATISYTISVVPNNEEFGSVTGSGEYNQTEQVTLTATPATGYKFINWTEDGEEVSISEEYVFTAEEARNLVANFEVSTHISREKLPDFKVYPNPAFENCRVKFENTDGSPVVVQLSNNLGQVLLQKEVSSQGVVHLNFNTSQLKSGIYFISIKSEEMRQIGKIIISKTK